MKRFLILSESLREMIQHLPPDLKRKVRHALTEITEDPGTGKALIEELQGLRSYKLGRMRIIYRIEEPSIVLIAFGPRKTIYQKLTLELREKSDQF